MVQSGSAVGTGIKAQPFWLPHTCVYQRAEKFGSGLADFHTAQPFEPAQRIDGGTDSRNVPRVSN
ncbi:MAG: hypothetical protein ACYCQL_06230 [Acidithiobacillus sp.]